jgi:hypothetical protein
MKRYEQIVLVALGYAIGFTTAFLWFQISASTPATVREHTRQQDYGLVANITEAQRAIEGMSIENAGLFATIEGKKRVISATALPETIGPGFHYAIVDAIVSPDHHFLYYCAQFRPQDDICTPFVYEAATDTVHPVKVSGDNVTVPVATVSGSWTPAGKLTISGHTSVQHDQPWIME